MRGDIADVLGASGVFFDPLWRIELELTPLELRLLRSRSVRRLAFISHAGAGSIATTQSYSRLEHSLGLLALVGHFTPQDHTARVAALLHDIGHLPFSHTFEGLAGLDHHRLGAARIAELSPLLAESGIDPDEVISIDRGTRESVLHNAVGALRLDHLESFVRSGRSHGRTLQPPATTLQHLRISNGAVDTDENTAAYLNVLITGEARSHLSELNVIANGILRHLAATVLREATPAEVADIARLTDDQFWSVLLRHADTAEVAQQLRDDPLRWRAEQIGADGIVGTAEFEHTVHRLYLDQPLIEGRPDLLPQPDLSTPPVRYRITATE